MLSWDVCWIIDYYHFHPPYEAQFLVFYVAYVHLDPFARDTRAGVLLQQRCLRLGETSS